MCGRNKQYEALRATSLGLSLALTGHVNVTNVPYVTVGHSDPVMLRLLLRALLCERVINNVIM